MGGISNDVHTTDAVNRMLVTSSGSATAIFWFGFNLAGETTWAPTVERSITVAVLPSSCAVTFAAILNRGARRVPRWSSAGAVGGGVRGTTRW